jgi:hypothetical protein
MATVVVILTRKRKLETTRKVPACHAMVSLVLTAGERERKKNMRINVP